MKKTVKLILLTLLVLVLAWPIYYFIIKSGTKDQKYTLEKPITKDLQNFIICSGVILPKEEVEIKSRVSGVLDQIYVRPGDSVHKNQVIAKIRIIADIGEIAAAESKINTAHINFENQKSIYNRNKILLEKEVISKTEFETVATNYFNAKEEINRANRDYTVIRTGNDPSRQSNTLIVSTIDGIVTMLPTKVGATITQSNNFNDGTTIAKVANINEMIFDGDVLEYDVDGLAIGMPVSITTALNKVKSDGILTEISTSGNNTDGIITFNIKSKIKSKNITRTGFSANAKILVKERKNVVCIKEEWVSFDNDSAYIQIHKNNTEFEKKYITLGMSDGIYTEVLSKLNKNEIIRVDDK